MNRRSFFRRTAGAVAAAVVAPQVAPAIGADFPKMLAEVPTFGDDTIFSYYANALAHSARIDQEKMVAAVFNAFNTKEHA